MNKFLKALVIMLCAIALVVGSVAATVAYLKMQTDTIDRTFTAGNIDITLTQDPTNLGDVKMVPGQTYEVNPVVTVKSGSEACWLFVKIDKTPAQLSTDPSLGFDTYLSFDVASGWIALDTVPGVYYRQVGATEADTSFAIISGNTVTAKNCKKDQYIKLTNSTATKLDLDFTAYAVQSVGFNTAAAAWAEAETLG